MPTEPSKQHILSLSDEDFGSYYGRDRTAKETAMKNANDEAGAKAAEAEYFKDKRLKKEGKGDLDLSGKQEAMQKLREFSSGQRSGSSLKGGAGGSGEGGPSAELKSIMNPKAMKKGGKVKSASARADGCCIRGKTRA